MSEPPARHRAHAAAFDRLVQTTAAWDGPTPVAAWTTRDIVRHLVEWFPPFLAAGSGLRLDAGPAVDDDPVGAWTRHAAAVQGVLDDPASAALTFVHPHVPACPLPDAVDRFYTTDVFLHTWDLAQATGQPHGLDPGECAELLAGMEPLDEMLRASGQYGPRVAVPLDSDPVTRLMAFIGRDPHWSTATTRN